MKKKLLFLILAVVMVAGVLSGCAALGSQGASGGDGRGTQAGKTGIAFPLAEQVEITIATEDGTVASLADNLPLWKEIQRRTNVKINWEVTAPAQYVEAMKLRIDGGGDPPDVLLLPNGLNLGELGGNGTIIPLEDYINQYGENIKNMYKSFPHVKSLTSADGHIYSINTVSENAYFMPYGFAIRKDWLDRLGLDEPETIDDWMTVLRAFRDEDADGDGDPNNEIPFSVGGHVWYTTFWAHAWGLHLFYSEKTRPYARSGLVLPPATEEESAIISGKSGDLVSYIWEMTGKFIVGTEDIDEKWDSYVSHVKELGVDDILAVKQAQYNRLKN